MKRRHPFFLTQHHGTAFVICFFFLLRLVLSQEMSYSVTNSFAASQFPWQPQFSTEKPFVPTQVFEPTTSSPAPPPGFYQVITAMPEYSRFSLEELLLDSSFDLPEPDLYYTTFPSSFPASSPSSFPSSFVLLSLLLSLFLSVFFSVCLSFFFLFFFSLFLSFFLSFFLPVFLSFFPSLVRCFFKFKHIESICCLIYSFPRFLLVLLLVVVSSFCSGLDCCLFFFRHGFLCCDSQVSS